MTVELYRQHMINRNGWATATEIQAAANLFGLNINIWLQQSSHCTLSSFNASSPTCIDILLSRNHFSPLKLVPPITDNSFDILKKQLKRQGQQNKTSNNKKRKLSTKITPHLEEGNRQTEQESEKQCQFIYTAELCEEKDFENVSVPHLSVQNKTARVQQKKESKLIKTKQSFNKSPDTHENLHSQKPESFSESNDTNYFHNSQLEINRKSIHEINNANQNVMSTDDLCSQHNKHSNNCNHEDPSQSSNIYDPLTDTLYLKCRKLGVPYESPSNNEAKSELMKRKRRLQYKIQKKIEQINMSEHDVPAPPPLHENQHFNKFMDCIRSFELKQMSLNFKFCTICKERRIETKMSFSSICKRCNSDKKSLKLFSFQNNMDPQSVPPELSDLSIIEQQLICRISPCINIHMLKHGGIASAGHCVTFPQEVNEPAKISPRLSSEINIVRVRKLGKNDTSKDYSVRRQKIQEALLFLKNNNSAYTDIIISQDRLNSLPVDGELTSVQTVEFNPDTVHDSDLGPAPNQTDPGEINGTTHSSVLLPDPNINIQKNCTRYCERCCWK